VRATTRGAVDTVYDDHAVYAPGIVGWETPAQFARGGYWLAKVDTDLTLSKLVDFDVNASSLEDMTVDLVLYLA